MQKVSMIKMIGMSLIGLGLMGVSPTATALPFPFQETEKPPEPIMVEPQEKKKKDPNKKAKLTKLFRDDSPIKVSLHLPLMNIRGRRMGKTGELPAKLITADDEGNPITFDIKVELRGISRQSKDTCVFPPIKLNFKKSQVKKTIFAKQNKLKLVTYCNKNSSYIPYYLKEYLAYRIYNILTDYSFKVRLLEVTYLNEKGEGKPLVRTGFVIEDVDDLAARHGMVSINIPKSSSAKLDYTQGNLDGFFQYFIANLDWSMISAAGGKDCCHNGKLLQAADGRGPVFPVPYDFDYSGFVNAPYAVPPTGYSAKRVTQRLYKGFCRHEGENGKTLTLFNEKRVEINELVMNFGLLNERDRVRTVNFLNKFYDIINNPKQLASKVTKKCIGGRDG